MTLCAKCENPCLYGSKEIGDELYCVSCAEEIETANREDAERIAAWDAPVTGFFSVIEKEDRKARKAGMIERTRELEKAE